MDNELNPLLSEKSAKTILDNIQTPPSAELFADKVLKKIHEITSKPSEWKTETIESASETPNESNTEPSNGELLSVLNEILDKLPKDSSDYKELSSEIKNISKDEVTQMSEAPKSKLSNIDTKKVDINNALDEVKNPPETDLIEDAGREEVTKDDKIEKLTASLPKMIARVLSANGIISMSDHNYSLAVVGPDGKFLQINGFQYKDESEVKTAFDLCKKDSSEMDKESFKKKYGTESIDDISVIKIDRDEMGKAIKSEPVSFSEEDDSVDEVILSAEEIAKKVDPSSEIVDASESDKYRYGATVKGPKSNKFMIFKDRSEAENYVANHGGKVIEFDEKATVGEVIEKLSKSFSLFSDDELYHIRYDVKEATVSGLDNIINYFIETSDDPIFYGFKVKQDCFFANKKKKFEFFTDLDKIPSDYIIVCQFKKNSTYVLTEYGYTSKAANRSNNWDEYFEFHLTSGEPLLEYGVYKNTFDNAPEGMNLSDAARPNNQFYLSAGSNVGIQSFFAFTTNPKFIKVMLDPREVRREYESISYLINPVNDIELMSCNKGFSGNKSIEENGKFSSSFCDKSIVVGSIEEPDSSEDETDSMTKCGMPKAMSSEKKSCADDEELHEEIVKDAEEAEEADDAEKDAEAKLEKDKVSEELEKLTASMRKSRTFSNPQYLVKGNMSSDSFSSLDDILTNAFNN